MNTFLFALWLLLALLLASLAGAGVVIVLRLVGQILWKNRLAKFTVAIRPGYTPVAGQSRGVNGIIDNFLED